MIKNPRLRSDLSVTVVDDDKLFLGRERNISLIESPTAVKLSEYLDGTHTVDELLARLPAEPLSAVLGALTAFERRGFLKDGPASGAAQEIAFWDAAGVDPNCAQREIAAGRVELVALGGLDAGPVVTALQHGGFDVSRIDLAAATNGHHDPTAWTLVLVEDYLDPELAEINRHAHATGRRWLPAAQVDLKLWVGPAFVPNHTACWACMAQRLEGNRQLERYVAKKRSRHVGDDRPPALLTTTATIAAALATEIAMLTAAGRSPQRLINTVLTFDVLELESERHLVTRLPQCEVCGDPGLVTDKPARVTLQAGSKHWVDDGGHRIVGPQETFDRLQRHISPLTGAVSSVSSQNADQNGVTFSYSSGHNFALMQDNTYFLKKNLRGRSGGKGRTDLQARVGAICEAIERFNGVWRGDEPVQQASMSELGPDAVDIESLLLFSDAQYAGRDAWNAAQRSSYHIIPERLDPDLPIDWTRAWSLTDERERLVPSSYCWFGHPDLLRSFFCAADANGNAAGNTLEEAILQGLMELAERDSVALWWYNRLPCRAFDLDSIGEPYVDVVREHYARQDRTLWMLDITSDLGIPAFAGVSQRHGGPTEDLLIGFGAHLDPHTAAMRALTELNQFLPAVRERNPDGTTNYWMDDSDAIGWWTTQTLDGNPHLKPDSNRAPATPESFASLADDDLAEDIRTVVRRFADKGVETMVLDQTRPDIDLAVAKVMAPGLRHFWRRLGAGRLYDAPVEAGRLRTPYAESELNPESIFF